MIFKMELKIVFQLIISKIQKYDYFLYINFLAYDFAKFTILVVYFIDFVGFF